jgi:ubiquinone/menaquinone biosynthesis C-methylase UbiE
MTAYDSRRYALINRWDSSHLDKVDQLLGSMVGEQVLEVGCGAGHLTKRLAERGVDIFGIDANPQASDVSGTDRVRTMQAEDLDFDDGSFDVIISVHALEHLPALEAALTEMARVLRPGGRALFIYPAEPIMGLYAIPTSIILHGTPFRAREVHCQKLWPARLRSMVEPLGWSETHHEFDLFKSPQFVSVFSA